MSLHDDYPPIVIESPRSNLGCWHIVVVLAWVICAGAAHALGIRHSGLGRGAFILSVILFVPIELSWMYALNSGSLAALSICLFAGIPLALSGAEWEMVVVTWAVSVLAGLAWVVVFGKHDLEHALVLTAVVSAVLAALIPVWHEALRRSTQGHM